MKKYNRHSGYLYNLLIAFSMVLMLTGCTNKDDVISIFTGKTWKLTYISEKGKNIMYNFWGNDDTGYQSSMDALKSSSNFIIVFEGSDLNGVTGGSFNAYATSTKISGQWNADGSSNKLTISNVSAGTDADAYIGKSFIYGLENAQSYSGDENNLFIYYTEGQRTFFLAFAPQKK